MQFDGGNQKTDPVTELHYKDLENIFSSAEYKICDDGILMESLPVEVDIDKLRLTETDLGIMFASLKPASEKSPTKWDTQQQKYF